MTCLGCSRRTPAGDILRDAPGRACPALLHSRSGGEGLHELRFRLCAAPKTSKPATNACTGRTGRTARAAGRRGDTSPGRKAKRSLTRRPRLRPRAWRQAAGQARAVRMFCGAVADARRWLGELRVAETLPAPLSYLV